MPARRSAGLVATGSFGESSWPHWSCSSGLASSTCSASGATRCGSSAPRARRCRSTTRSSPERRCQRRWSGRSRAPGGLGDDPVVLRVSQSWFELFDYNDVEPQPAATTYAGGNVEWEFDPPPGDTLRVQLDGRIDPSSRGRREAEAQVLSGGTASSLARPSARGFSPDGDRRPRLDRVRLPVRAHARDGQARALRDDAVRAADARRDRRHHPAGRHAGGHVGDRRDARRRDDRAVGARLLVAGVPLAARAARARRRGHGASSSTDARSARRSTSSA